jgi:uncharacterized membrane protein YphA (DoxX/SURF4 family)
MSIQIDPLTPRCRVLPDLVRPADADPARETLPERTWSGDSQRRATTPQRIQCDVCGAGARVLILEGYAEGEPVLRRLCLTCAAASANPGLVGERPRIGLHVLVGLAGLVLCFVGLFGDYLVPPAHPGFGWHQQVGAGAGALLLVLGLVLRMDVVALGGAFLCGASLGADWFGLTHGPGIGWKQQVLIAMGAVGLLTAGVTRRMLAARRHKRDRSTGRAKRVDPGQPDGHTAVTDALPAAAP